MLSDAWLFGPVKAPAVVANTLATSALLTELDICLVGFFVISSRA